MESRFLKVAKEVGINAGKAVLSLRRKKHTFTAKKRAADFATEADFSSEKIVLATLQKEFPGHNFVSEEAGKIDSQSEYTWLIDPLDGTISYSSGLPTFGVSIGLVEKDEPIVGVINLPTLNYLLWAEKGKGAFLNGEKIYVSDKKELLKSVIGFDMGYVGMRRDELQKLAEPVVDKVVYMFQLGCSVAGVSYVAMGVYDAYLHSAHPWDFAAGAIIIEEAGGRVTDFSGAPIDWSKDWIDLFASNGLLHEDIFSLIR